MRVGLYLQNQCQSQDLLHKEFDHIMRIVSNSNLDLLVFPEHAWCPGVERFEALSLYDDSEEMQNAVFDDVIGKIVETTRCPIIFNHVNQDDLIVSVFTDGQSYQYCYKHFATHCSPFDFEDYEKILAEGFYDAIGIKGAKLGMTICHEATDPLISRLWGRHNVDLIANSTGGHVDYKKWTYYQKTRAIENNCFTLCIMSQNNDNAKNPSYAIGFDPWGRSIRFENSEGKIKKGKDFPEIAGEVYIADLDFSIRNILPLQGERDKFFDQESSINDNIDIFLQPQFIKDELTYCVEKDKGVYIKEHGNLNIVFLIINEREIYQPELIQSKVYSQNLKNIPNKRYVLINFWNHLERKEFECFLSTVIRTRAAENFCACILLTDSIAQCYQVGLAKNTQVIKLTDRGFGIDLSRTTGPEALWRNKNIPRMRANWRNNYEKLINFFSLNTDAAYVSLLSKGFNSEEFKAGDDCIRNEEEQLACKSKSSTLKIQPRESGEKFCRSRKNKKRIDSEPTQVLYSNAQLHSEKSKAKSSLPSIGLSGHDLSVVMTSASEAYDELVQDQNVQGDYWDTEDTKTTDDIGDDALLIDAVMSEEIDVVRNLLKRGVDLHAKNEDGLSALVIAVDTGQTEIAQELLKGGADPNSKDSSGNTVLLNAVFHDRPAMVQALLDRGANPDLLNQDGVSTLMFTAYMGKESMIKELLRSRSNSVTLCNTANLALIGAAIKGHVGVVRELLKSGANADFQNYDGETVLQAAVIQNNLQIVKELLEHEANPDKQNTDGLSPLEFAIHGGNENILRELLRGGANVNLKNPDGNTPLIFAIMKGKKRNIVRALLDAGADTTIRDKGGMTALMEAAARGREGLVVELLNGGADIKEKSDRSAGGFTPLIYAATAGQINIVKELLNRGAFVDEVSDDKITALMCAAAFGYLDIVRELLNRGANVKLRSRLEQTVLHQAVIAQKFVKLKCLSEKTPSLRHAQIVCELLRAGAEINAKNKDGATALHKAASTGQLPSVKELLINKADFNASDKHGNTALIYASSAGHLDIVKELLNRGADIGIMNHEGKDAFVEARAKDHKGIMQLLKSFANSATIRT